MSLQNKLTSERQTSKIPSYQLADTPDVPILTDYLHMIMDHQVDVLELRWPAEKQGEFYSLVLRAGGQQGEPKWSFHLVSSLLWEYQSCDVLLIHNMISMASNKYEQIVQGDGLLATSNLYRQVTKRSDAYYIRTETTSEHQPAAPPSPIAADVAPTVNTASAQAITPKAIDASAIESIMLKLRDPQTGLFTYPAFLYFLEQVYFQSCRTRSPFSLLLIGLNNGLGTLKKEEIFEIVTRLSAIKRRTDVLAQYDSGDIVILAPSTNKVGAEIFAKRLVKAIEGIHPYTMGVATFPQDGESMGMLLSLMEASKNADSRPQL